MAWAALKVYGAFRLRQAFGLKSSCLYRLSRLPLLRVQALVTLPQTPGVQAYRLDPAGGGSLVPLVPWVVAQNSALELRFD